jgi:hypothetical protein
MTKRILLAVDTNTASEPVNVAGDLAELSSADVLVLHCDELDTVFDMGIWLHDDTEPRTAIGAAVGQLRDRGVKARGVTVRTDSPEKTAEAIIHRNWSGPCVRLAWPAGMDLVVTVHSRRPGG